MFVLHVCTVHICVYKYIYIYIFIYLFIHMHVCVLYIVCISRDAHGIATIVSTWVIFKARNRNVRGRQGGPLQQK